MEACHIKLVFYCLYNLKNLFRTKYDVKNESEVEILGHDNNNISYNLLSD